MRGFSFFFRNFASLLSFVLPLLEKVPSKLFPSQLNKFIASLARTGRDFQRYNRKGHRQVVGCIPYRYKETCDSAKEIEVLVVSATKGGGMLFPKGGWEKDEKINDAVLRETWEEAGVHGKIECKLGSWSYKSKRGEIMHEGHMFQLQVEKQFDFWPEKSTRKRRWVSIEEAREVCQQWWMSEALEAFIESQKGQL